MKKKHHEGGESEPEAVVVQREKTNKGKHEKTKATMDPVVFLDFEELCGSFLHHLISQAEEHRSCTIHGD